MPRVSEEMANRFLAETASGYREWIQKEGLSMLDGHYVPNLGTMELQPWKRRGGFGAYINHEASIYSNDCYVCEIPEGGKLQAQRQLFEELVYVLKGRGATSVWNDDGQRVTFEWQAGSLFAIPLNSWHQHFNSSGEMAARYVGITNAPVVMNIYKDPEFVFNTKYNFGCFTGLQDFFNGTGVQKGYIWETNFVADLLKAPLMPAKERGAGGGHLRFSFASGSLLSHISEFPVGTYKKAHRHGPGAHVIVLGGQGYSLMWPEGAPINRYDWQPGSLVIPPDQWYHQHFNTGQGPARYLALKFEGTMDRNEQGVPCAWISTREGGKQINYADEDPAVRRTFESELETNGLQSRMGAIYEAELESIKEQGV